MGCTFMQLKNKVKHFRDTVTKHDRLLDSKTPWIVSERDKFILENFGFLRKAVHKRENARKNSPRKQKLRAAVGWVNGGRDDAWSRADGERDDQVPVVPGQNHELIAAIKGQLEESVKDQTQELIGAMKAQMEHSFGQGATVVLTRGAALAPQTDHSEHTPLAKCTILAEVKPTSCTVTAGIQHKRLPIFTVPFSTPRRTARTSTVTTATLTSAMAAGQEQLSPVSVTPPGTSAFRGFDGPLSCVRNTMSGDRSPTKKYITTPPPRRSSLKYITTPPPRRSLLTVHTYKNGLIKFDGKTD